MTPSDDDLRRALTLLEQRRPSINVEALATHSSRQRPGRWLPLAAAALIAALALALALRGTLRSDPAATHTTTPHGGLAGFTWLATAVRTPHGDVDLQRDHPDNVNVNSGNSWMQFTGDGKYVASDGLTVTSGSYRTQTGELLLTATSSWSPTYPDPGRYPWAKLVTEALDAVANPDAHARIAITGGVLTLDVPGYEVRLSRASLDLGQPRSFSCPRGAKCPPPLLNAGVGVHLAVGDQKFNLSPAQAASVPLHIGQPVAIIIGIDRPITLAVSDIFISVNSYPSGSGPNGPIGRELTLTHHPGSLPNGDVVATTWTPKILYQTTNLDLTIEYSIGNENVSYAVAHLHLHG